MRNAKRKLSKIDNFQKYYIILYIPTPCLKKKNKYLFSQKLKIITGKIQKIIINNVGS